MNQKISILGPRSASQCCPGLHLGSVFSTSAKGRRSLFRSGSSSRAKTPNHRIALSMFLWNARRLESVWADNQSQQRAVRSWHYNVCKRVELQHAKVLRENDHLDVRVLRRRKANFKLKRTGSWPRSRTFSATANWAVSDFKKVDSVAVSPLSRC